MTTTISVLNRTIKTNELTPESLVSSRVVQTRISQTVRGLQGPAGASVDSLTPRITNLENQVNNLDLIDNPLDISDAVAALDGAIV